MYLIVFVTDRADECIHHERREAGFNLRLICDKDLLLHATEDGYCAPVEGLWTDHQYWADSLTDQLSCLQTHTHPAVP